MRAGAKTMDTHAGRRRVVLAMQLEKRLTYLGPLFTCLEGETNEVWDAAAGFAVRAGEGC